MNFCGMIPAAYLLIVFTFLGTFNQAIVPCKTTKENTEKTNNSWISSSTDKLQNYAERGEPIHISTPGKIFQSANSTRLATISTHRHNFKGKYVCLGYLFNSSIAKQHGSIPIVLRKLLI